MNPAVWAMVHGATTHFPVALVLCSGTLEGAGCVLAARPAGRGLRQAGYWTILLAGLGIVPVIFSGVLMTKGRVLGHGALRMHHLFAWPAFGLILVLSTWRALVGLETPRGPFFVYLAALGAAAVLVLAAAYWGGEMLIQP